MTGIDYAGKIIYSQNEIKMEKDTSFTIAAASLGQSDLLPEQTLNEFIMSLKREIPRRR